MTGRRSKLVPLEEAAALVATGTRLAIGGFSLANRPMSFVRALVRNGVRELTVVEPVCGPELELLVGAEAVVQVETSYVGLERFGLAPRVRRAIESGRLRMVEYGEVMMFDRFRATQDNWSFLPVSYLAGTSMLEENPEIREFKCPLTGRPMHAVPPADPEVTVIHVAQADQYGNAILEERALPHGIDLLLSRSARTLILTAEEIVPTNELIRNPRAVQVPAFLTTAVSEAPRGAHPCPMIGMYDSDDEHFAVMVTAGATAESFESYLNTYARSPRDHDAYLRVIDHGRRSAPSAGGSTRDDVE